MAGRRHLNSNSTAVETRSRRAKRARTEVAVADTNNWRDWGNLTAGPAGLIAEQLLADDVAGYLRFRAVCGSWRRCAPPPHAHDVFDRRFHPRRWIMLPEIFPGQFQRRDFLNVTTGERIRVDLPGLRHEFVIGPTSEGLILLCRKRTGAVRLLNPLTGVLTALPDATSMLCSLNRPYSSRWKSRNGLNKLKSLQGFSAGLAGCSTVALHFHEHEHELAFAEPDGEQWIRRVRPCSITAILEDIVSALSFANRFYCVTRNGIRVLDADAGVGGRRPRLVAVEVNDGFRHQRVDGILADNDGQLILLRPNYGSNTEPYDVRRVDLDVGEMVPVHGLRGRAVFVCHSGAGRGRSLSVHAGLSSSIRADAIYRCRSHRGDMADGRPRIDVFLVPDDRWIEHDLRVPPGSIVDYLSRYVCRSGDIVVSAPPLLRSVSGADD